MAAVDVLTLQRQLPTDGSRSCHDIMVPSLVGHDLPERIPLQGVDMVDRRRDLLELLAGHQGPLARLVAADELAQELRVILRQVAIEAHDAGYTWEDIGTALGVSRAAAHERLSPGNRRASSRSRRAR